MQRFKFEVVVTAENAARAMDAIQNRLDHDENYGYEYTIDIAHGPERLPDPPEEILDRIASELALIDRYDPNQLTPLGWKSVKEGYEAKARRVLEAMNGN